MIIKTMDDVKLVPTPVGISDWEKGVGRVERIEERLQAKLFPELKGKPVTVVLSAAMGGHPFCEADIRFNHALAIPGVLWLYWLKPRKRNTTSTSVMLPADPVILLKGHHALDFGPLVPSSGEMLIHTDFYGDTWRKVSAYCTEVAGVDAVLIDTSEATALWHVKWLPEHRADMARRREREASRAAR